MPSDESKGSQLDAIGSLAQRQLDNTVRSYPVSAGFRKNRALGGQKSEKVASRRRVISVIPSGYILEALFQL